MSRFLVFLLILFCLSLNADDENSGIDFSLYRTQPNNFLDLNMTFIYDTGKFIERHRVDIYDDLLNFSKTLDQFFSSDTFVYENDNSTYGKLELISRKIEGEELLFLTNVKLFVDLPNTKKRVKFSFANTDEEEKGRKDNNPIDTVDKSDFVSSFKYIHKATKFINLQASIGSKLPPKFNPFVYFRGRRSFIFDSFNLSLAQKFTFFTNTGDEYLSSIDFDRKLNDSYHLRFSNSGKYIVNDEYFDLLSSVGLYQKVNKYKGYKYFATVLGNDKNGVMTDGYVYGVQYKNIFYDGYYIDITPEIISHKDYNFEYKWSLTFKLGVVFE